MVEQDKINNNSRKSNAADLSVAEQKILEPMLLDAEGEKQ